MSGGHGSGPFAAYPDGPPEGVNAPADALKESATPLNVVIVADTDLLLDYTWLQQQNFFGQVVMQPMADNGALVWNAVDNLGEHLELRPYEAFALLTSVP